MYTHIFKKCALFLAIVMIHTQKSPAHNDDAVRKIILQRYSGYAFDPQRSIPHDQLKIMAQAAQWTPSSYNDQPWYFIICDKTTHEEAYNKVLASLVEFNQQWAENAPILIVVVAATISPYTKKLNPYAQYDTGAAAFALMLQATALGLMAHQMGGFDAAKISKTFEIPSEFIPVAVMAIGYPLPETQTRKRERNQLYKQCMLGTWDLNQRDVWEE